MWGVGYEQAFSIVKQVIFCSYILFEFTWYCTHSKSLQTCTSILDFKNVYIFSFAVHSKFWSSFLKRSFTTSLSIILLYIVREMGLEDEEN